jgi:hypothetical protein
MRRVVTCLELAAAATVTAPCNRTVVAGVAALPCAMVVAVVAVHVVSSGKKVSTLLGYSSIKKKEKGKKKMYQGSSPCCRCCCFGVAAAAAVSSYRRGSRVDD